MIQDYLKHAAEREALGVPPLPLTSNQAEGLVELLQDPPKGYEDLLVDLLENRVSPGVDPAAKVKAGFLNAIAPGEAKSPLVSAEQAVELLGTMLGGYNVPHLIRLLDQESLAEAASRALARTFPDSSTCRLLFPRVTFEYAPQYRIRCRRGSGMCMITRARSSAGSRVSP